MSKITNGGLTRSGNGCFIPVSIWQERASKVNLYVSNENTAIKTAHQNNYSQLRSLISCKSWYFWTFFYWL